MDIAIFLNGLVLGFSIAAPVGPIGLLCIQRTLENGRISGIATGFGAATADMIYGAIAAFGLTVVAGLLLSYSNLLRILGGIFLVYLGIKTFSKNIEITIKESSRLNIIKSYVSAFFLTLTNPMTILAFIAIFSGIGFISKNTDILSAISLVLGVFFGSIIWWLILSTITNLVRNKINIVFQSWINRTAGVMIICFGLVNIYSVFKNYWS